VMHGDNLSYAETFEAALEGLFDDDSSEAIKAQPQTTLVPRSLGETARRANDVFEHYVRLQGEGRFSEAGLELERLQALLQGMMTQQEIDENEEAP
jgi:uncharacterized membrane protein (UPF0182 family)